MALEKLVSSTIFLSIVLIVLADRYEKLDDFFHKLFRWKQYDRDKQLELFAQVDKIVLGAIDRQRSKS